MVVYPYLGMLFRNQRDELLMHPITWMNFKVLYWVKNLISKYYKLCNSLSLYFSSNKIIEMEVILVAMNSGRENELGMAIKM